MSFSPTPIKRIIDHPDSIVTWTPTPKATSYSALVLLHLTGVQNYALPMPALMEEHVRAKNSIPLVMDERGIIVCYGNGYELTQVSFFNDPFLLNTATYVDGCIFGSSDDVNDDYTI